MTYSYDTNGNIVSKTPYTNVTTTDLTTATAGAAIAYGYTDSTWSDKLTSYNGQSITYDASGNPTSYKGATLTWNGRLLTSYENGADRYEYGYNSDGLRVSKKVFDNGTLSQSQKYVWSDGKLVGMKFYNSDSNQDSFIRYIYDENNEAVGMKFEEFTFLFVKNLQGDVISILKAETDEACLNLTYDAWGKVSIHPVSQNLGAIIGAILVAGLNNFTYRGYFCDYDTGLYYLQSRYYDPETGRFINADDTEYLSADNRWTS